MMDFEASGSQSFVIAMLGGKAIRLKSESWMHVITTMEMMRINRNFVSASALSGKAVGRRCASPIRFQS
jgi:hypothetical protein